MKLVKKNQKLHNPDSPLLIEDVKDGDVVNRLMNPAILINNKNRFDFFTFNIYIFNFIGLKFISNFHIDFHLTENNIDFIIYFSLY